MTPGDCRAVWALATLSLGIALAGERAAAQDPGPLLPADHWVRPVLHRLDGLGRLPLGLDPAADGWTRGSALRALKAASVMADGEAVGGDGGVARIAGAAARRLRLERVRGRTAEGAGPRLLPAWIEVAGWREEGELLASFDTTASGPRVAARERPVEQAALAGRLAVATASAWAEAEVGIRDDGLAVLRSAHALITLGPVGVWGGRRALRLGPVPGSAGLVLSGGPPVDGGGLTLVRSVRMPKPFRWLGPVSGGVTLGRLDRAGPTAEPWLWSFYASIRPHPRLRIGVERAALLGGVGNRLSVLDVPAFLAGMHGGDASEVDNQVFALDVWYRLPWQVLPIGAYVSYGFDDSAGAWESVPAFLFGLELAALPGAPAISVSLEHGRFAGRCCGNPPWYRHLQLPWVNGRALLGHPLGGHGSEWRLRLRGDGLVGTWGRLAVYTRERRSENLAWPLRTGRSVGIGSEATARPSAGRVELLLSGSVETAGDWTSWRADARLRVWF